MSTLHEIYNSITEKSSQKFSVDQLALALAALIADLRAQGLGNALARPAAPLGKAALARAEAAFRAQGDAGGRVTEHFEILTLSGWREA